MSPWAPLRLGAALLVLVLSACGSSSTDAAEPPVLLAPEMVVAVLAGSEPDGSVCEPA